MIELVEIIAAWMHHFSSKILSITRRARTWFALAAGAVMCVGSAVTPASPPEFDDVYILKDGLPVSLTQTGLNISALLQLLASDSDAGTDVGERLEHRVDMVSDANRLDFDFYVRISSSRMPVVKCIPVGPAGYSAGAVSTAQLNTTDDTAVWQASCKTAPLTSLIFVNLIAEANAEEIYVVTINEGDRVLRNFLDRADLDPYFRTDMAALVQRLYPDFEKARQIFYNVSPFIQQHIARSRQRLLGNTLDQYLKQEEHSYSLAMRNGVRGRGYRLQDYLRDYPSGRFAAEVRVEIPERKREIFIDKPRWAERRAENNLQMVLMWKDTQRKVNALRKYIVAYPHGRLVSLVRTEIGRVSNSLGAGAPVRQMTAENLSE